MKLALALCVLAGFGFGQTRPTINQTATPPVTAPSVLMILPNGGISVATIDDSTVVYDPATRVLRAILPIGPTEIWNETATLTAAAPTFTLRNVGNITALRFYRNGVRLTPVVDYTMVRAVLTFVAGAVPQAGDILTADYRFQP